MSGLFASTMSANAEAIRSRSSASEMRARRTGSSVHRPPDEVGRGELVEQAPVEEVEETARHVRVVPATAPLAEDADGDGAPAGRPEDVEALARGEDPGQRVDLDRAPARAAGLLPSQCSCRSWIALADRGR